MGIAPIGFAPLSEWFDFETEDPLHIYPFEVKCLVALFHPGMFEALGELGRLSIDFIYGRYPRPSRQIRSGMVVLYMPERWLSVREKQGLMQALCDLHETYPLKYVHIITGEPLFLTDMTSRMVRKLVIEQE